MELQKIDKKDILSNVRVENDMFSLNDLHEIAGKPINQDPRQWVRLETTVQLIETVEGILNVGKSHIIKSKRGKGGGTYAHKNIALAYAKYLDPKLHVLVNEVFFERIEEEKNPDLAIERGIKGTRTGNDGVMHTTITPKVTGKGQVYFVNKFLATP